MECVVCQKTIPEQSINKFTYVKNCQEYQLYQCTNCDLQFWWPMRFYARFYEEELPEHELLSLGSRPLADYARYFFSHFPAGQGRLLDVGCSDGAFVAAAQKAGFNAEGIDLDDKAITAGRRYRQLQTINKEYLSVFSQNLASTGERFDIVTFFEVLEHQADLKGFIAEIKNCLKPGGKIAGSVPNRERYFANLHKASELGDYPPAHFTRWSKPALTWFLKAAGFTDIKIMPIGYNNVWSVVNNINASLWDGLAQRLKRAILRDARKAALSFSGLDGEEGSVKIYLLKILKAVPNILLWPLGLVLFRDYKKRGIHLFFTAEYKGGK